MESKAEALGTDLRIFRINRDWLWLRPLNYKSITYSH